jgi:uncharacterized membrane protein
MDSANQSPSQGSSPVTPGAEKNILMAVLSYIGPLVIISYLSAKNDSFVNYHIRQGLVLLVIEVASWFLGHILWPLWLLLQLVNLGILVLSIIGIINAAKGEEKEVPLVGSYAKHFKI